MKSAGIYPVSAWVVLVSWSCLGQSSGAQSTSLLGKIQDVGLRGITVIPNESKKKGPNRTDQSYNKGKDAQPVFVAAGRKTQVRMNILATPDRIRPGAYVEMRVLWDGESALRATSIKFPEGIATKFGLYKG
jgi:hypothetical protein